MLNVCDFERICFRQGVCALLILMNESLLTGFWSFVHASLYTKYKIHVNAAAKIAMHGIIPMHLYKRNTGVVSEFTLLMIYILDNDIVLYYLKDISTIRAHGWRNGLRYARIAYIRNMKQGPLINSV